MVSTIQMMLAIHFLCFHLAFYKHSQPSVTSLGRIKNRESTAMPFTAYMHLSSGAFAKSVRFHCIIRALPTYEEQRKAINNERLSRTEVK